ncbi:chaperone protein HtpG [Gordonia araii NBRC 100433]|uniref:Chaperone protein HtpG n=1 Tax=Gordonia araii NBRC 100433 TaxID=1073574 RepID=G7H0L8_9ACTN|nr:molecular chaperone HtpG [Gordonia araii]NNG96844.1 molecular chaperone HtpG [Gordonia araii NBRC 100433]GAB09393.1 chaperone protein HtpG [Gordonia araii NBRC 100433]
MAQAETREFQAETRQLLDLMVHSVYSNKDSFLRELISNSSDALDKLRLESLRDKDLDVDTDDLRIVLEPHSDGDVRSLVVADNGIGMSRDEVVDLIGTLARSGTGELRRKLAEAKDAAASDALIGQFGIGFYSTFMVADKVTLVTRKAGETTGTKWESGGDGTYTLETVDDASQGTSVTLALKPVDAEDHLHDYADPAELRALVKRYSDFISWPIKMEVTVPAPPAEEGGEPGESTTQWQTLNSGKALWARPRDEVSDEEYAEFYRHVSHAWDSPLEVVSVKAEGTFEYEALLFLPSQAPFDLFAPVRHGGIHLYVKRVFIMDDADLLPEYLRFVAGVVDAADLSLNVSREILQQDRQIRAIRRRLTKKVIATVNDLRSSRPDDYRAFWGNFGRVFKEGLVNDPDNQDAILKASVFTSTDASADGTEGLTSLAEYVGRMKAGQDAIYYMTGESQQQIRNSPHMEAFAAKGIEVLTLDDPVDEMWVTTVAEFDGHPFVSIAKGSVDLDAADGEDEKDAEKEREKQSEEFADLLTWLGATLADDITEARISSRLTDSAACLVGEAHSMSPQLEKLYRASGQPVPHVKRALELNPKHPLVAGLRKAFGDEGARDGLRPTAQLLYGLALLAEGGELPDPAAFAKTLADQLAAQLDG